MSRRSGSASAVLGSTGGWDGFFSRLVDLALDHGAAGLSLGVVLDGRVATYNHGFTTTTSTAYAEIDLRAELPGPAVLRSRATRYFEDEDETLREFPAAAPIHAETEYGAAAVLLLAARDGTAELGYLALHYVGPHRFDDALRLRLEAAAAEVAEDLRALVTSVWPHEPGLVVAAMRSRAVVERAVGHLMARDRTSAAQARQALAELARQQSSSVHDAARSLLGTDDGPS